MSCPSKICTNLSNYAVAEGSQGPFGTIVRRYGRNLQLDGQGINMLGPGYYDLSASLSFIPTATGPVTIQFYQDGVEVRSAVATSQGTASEPVNLFVTSELRNCGCDCNTTLAYTISAAGTIANLTTTVGKD